MVLLSAFSGDEGMEGYVSSGTFNHPCYASGTNVTGSDSDSGGTSHASRCSFSAFSASWQISSGSYQAASGSYFARCWMKINWTNKATITELHEIFDIRDGSNNQSWKIEAVCNGTTDTTYDFYLSYFGGGAWNAVATLLDVIPDNTWVYWELETNNSIAAAGLTGALYFVGQNAVTWTGLTATYKAECSPKPSAKTPAKGTGTPTIYSNGIVSNDSSGSGLTGRVTTGTTPVAMRSGGADVWSFYPDAEGDCNFATVGQGTMGHFCRVDDFEDGGALTAGTREDYVEGGSGNSDTFVFNCPGVTLDAVDGVCVVIAFQGSTFPASIDVSADGEASTNYTSANWKRNGSSTATQTSLWLPLTTTPAGTLWTWTLVTGMKIKINGPASGTCKVAVVRIDVMGTNGERMTKNSPCSGIGPALASANSLVV